MNHRTFAAELTPKGVATHKETAIANNLKYCDLDPGSGEAKYVALGPTGQVDDVKALFETTLGMQVSYFHHFLHYFHHFLPFFSNLWK